MSKRTAIKCPFHDDKHPSACLKQADSSKWYFYCYVCDIQDDYWALLSRIEGRQVTEVLKEKAQAYAPVNDSLIRTFDAMVNQWKSKNPTWTIEEKNPYTDPRTCEPDFGVVRYRKPNDPKKYFAQMHKNGDGGWHMSAPKVKPLFNRFRIAECENILIVEGEKCVRAFTALDMPGWAATTNPGGANAYHNTDWSPLKGKKCVIWHDNDEPGRKHFEGVKEILLGLECAVSRVRVEELGLDEKEDIVDYLAGMPEGMESQVAAVQLVLMDVEDHGKVSALQTRLEAIASGEYRHIAFSRMPRLSTLSQALLPGTVTTLCGEPGAGKSFFILEQFWRWILEKDEKVSLFMFEEDDTFHQQRMLAQLEGRSEFTDIEYCQENADVVLKSFQHWKPVIEKISKRLYTSRSEQKTLMQMADWVEEQAIGGADIIIVDPVTAALQSATPWLDDQKYMFRVKSVAEATGARVLQTIHPRGGKAGAPGLSGMAGGLAYPRFSQTVLWLSNFDQPQDFIEANEYTPRQYKQSMQIRKCRNGKGQGTSLAANLNFHTLCMDELGIIPSDK